MELKLSPKRLLVSWFLFSVDMVGQFFGVDLSREKVSPGTNICMFTQLSVLGFLVLLINVVFVVAAVWFVVISPLQNFGWTVVTSVLGVSLAVIVIMLSIRLIQRLVRMVNKYRYSRYSHYLRRLHLEEDDRETTEKRPEEPTVFQIFWQWILSIKEKLCPRITWLEPISKKKNFIAEEMLDIKDLALLGFFLLLVAGGVHAIPAITLEAKKNFSQSFVGNCEVLNASKRHESIQLNLNCDGKESWTMDDEIVIYFMNNPDVSLSCRVYEDSEAFCDIP